MTERLTTYEKIIGGLFIITGLFAIVMTFWGLTQIWETALRNKQDEGSTDLSFLTFILFHHYKILLPPLTIFSGVIIFFKRKVGLVTGLIVSILNLESIIFGLLRLNKKVEQTEPMYLAIAVGLFFTFLSVLLFLTDKVYKEKIGSRTWGTITIIILVLLLDGLNSANI